MGVLKEGQRMEGGKAGMAEGGKEEGSRAGCKEGRVRGWKDEESKTGERERERERERREREGGTKNKKVRDQLGRV